VHGTVRVVKPYFIYRTVRFVQMPIPKQFQLCMPHVCTRHGSVRLTLVIRLYLYAYLRCIITYMLCELWGDIALTSSGSAVAPCGPYRSHCREPQARHVETVQEKGRAPAAQLRAGTDVIKHRLDDQTVRTTTAHIRQHCLTETGANNSLAGACA
jgi:hypothetical protein